jgi:hypothetical protein
MKRTLSNRPVAVLVAVFTVIVTPILHSNPFGGGTIDWPFAFIVALAGNLFLAYVLSSWAAPYLASTGGKAGAETADPDSVKVAERWTAGTLMVFGAIAMLSVGLASSDVIVTPTERTQKNAQLVKRVVELKAPQKYQELVGSADTWKMSEKTLRTCVPEPSGDLHHGWCVLIKANGDDLKVVSSGPGLSNAAQFLKWHPGYKPPRQYQ